MEITVVKIDKYDATIRFTPNWLGNLFGLKTRMEQFRKTHGVWWLSNESVWRSYSTGDTVPQSSKLQDVLTKGLWLKQNKAKGIL
jgi:hypothetical protein